MWGGGSRPFPNHKPYDEPAGRTNLLLVAANPGASVSELAEAADCKLPQMSRSLSDMGSHNRKGEPGLGLVETIVDEQEHRRKHALLTAQGQEVVKRLVGLLNGREATTHR